MSVSVIRADCYAAVNLGKETISGSADECKAIFKEHLHAVQEQTVVNIFNITG